LKRAWFLISSSLGNQSRLISLLFLWNRDYTPGRGAYPPGTN
jgi:hypothetical protein